ncbi:MAG: D-aminoacyl-tRNA deacylase [Flavobacteriaceae bacterium]|nr:D-aminoacyl-tRNA deacylase [Flavobacteriaceae bacterium]
MRAVVQRVKWAKVEVNNAVAGAIEQGLLVFLGIESADFKEDIEWLAKKIMGMRIFSDADGKMNLSVKEINGSILVISQFTLHASTKKGNRPSFIKAAAPNYANDLYQSFNKSLEELLGKPIQTGVFGADMQVQLHNDGPVTIIINSKNRE